jgi:hypothetical protein
MVAGTTDIGAGASTGTLGEDTAAFETTGVLVVTVGSCFGCKREQPESTKSVANMIEYFIHLVSSLVKVNRVYLL